MLRLRIATCRPLPEPDPDEQLLLNAFAAVGIGADMVPWHDAHLWQSHQPDSQIPVLIRSTWDYIHQLAAFDHWLQQLATLAPVWNPSSVVRENLHKKYLLNLAASGVSTTPTLWVTQGHTRSLQDWVATVGWSDVVIKPAVSAGSFDTHRLRVGDAAAEVQWRASVIQRDMLIQPYLASVEAEGEHALVWIDGEFTHAVRKTPRFAADMEQVSPALSIPSEARVVGEAALRVVADSESLVYARVDVARDEAGQWRIMELELIEPSLFLAQYPPALHRLVEAVRRRLILTQE